MFEVGQTIDDQYRIERRLEGGMGVVYIVRDSVTGKRYALKGLKDAADEGSSDAERTSQAARFEREATAWVNLDHHPHIVQAHAFLKRAESPLLLLEYVDGPSLQSVLHRVGRLTLGQALVWSRQLCAAMQYVHTKELPSGQRGMLHRDLKPANVLVTRRGQMKITDFGLAKLDDDRGLSKTGEFMGTLSYSSPEQVRDAKHVDGRSDIYSFGVILYRMLSGGPPFEDESLTGLIQAINHKQPDWNALPPAITPIVQRCMEKSPERRYGLFEEIDRELENLTASLTTARPENVCPRCGFIGAVNDECVVCGETRAGEGVDEFGETQLGAASTVTHAPAQRPTHCACGARWEADMQYCRHCGRERSGVTCECGRMVPAGNSFCTRCGSRVG